MASAPGSVKIISDPRSAVRAMGGGAVGDRPTAGRRPLDRRQRPAMEASAIPKGIADSDAAGRDAGRLVPPNRSEWMRSGSTPLSSARAQP